MLFIPARYFSPIPQPSPSPLLTPPLSQPRNSIPVAPVERGQSVRIPALIQNIHQTQGGAAQADKRTILSLLDQVDTELAGGASKQAIQLLSKELAQLHLHHQVAPGGAQDEVGQKIVEQASRLQSAFAKRMAYSQFGEAIASRGAGHAAARRAEARYEAHSRRLVALREQIQALKREISDLTLSIRVLEHESAPDPLTKKNILAALQRNKLRVEERFIRAKHALAQAQAESPASLKRFGASKNIVALDFSALAAIKAGEPSVERIAADMADLQQIPGVIQVAVAATVKAPVTESVPSTIPGQKPTEKTTPRIIGVAQQLLEHATVLWTFMHTADRTIENELYSRIDPLSYQRNALYGTINASWDLHAGNLMLCVVPNDAYNRLMEKAWEYETAPTVWKRVDSFNKLLFERIAGTITDTTNIRETTCAPQPLAPSRTIVADAELRMAMSVKLEERQFDNERLLNLGRREWHTGDSNNYQTWNGEAVLPTRSCLLGQSDALDPLLPEVRDHIRALDGHRAAIKEYITQGDARIWQHLSSTTKQALQNYLNSNAYKHYDPDSLEKRTHVLRSMPEALRNKVYNELAAASLPTPNLPEVAALMKQQIDIVKRLLLDLQSILAQEGVARATYDTIARVFIRNLNNYRRADKNNAAYCEEAIKDFMALWSITRNVLSDRAKQLITDLKKAITAMDEHVRTSIPLRMFKKELLHLRSTSKTPLCECRTAINICSKHLSTLQEHFNRHGWDRGAHVCALNTLEVAIDCVSNAGLASDLQQRLVSRANQLKNSLPVHPALLVDKKKEELFAFLREAEQEMRNSLSAIESRIFPSSLAARLFPPIAPQEAEALDRRMVNAGEYLTLCEEGVKKCSRLRGVVETTTSLPTWSAANREAVAAALKQTMEQLVGKGLADDVKNRLWKEGYTLINALPAPLATLQPIQKDSFLQYITRVSQSLEPTSLGMHFFLFPKVKMILGILTHIRVANYCTKQRLPAPPHDNPSADAALYVQLRNEIFLEQRKYYKVDPGVDPQHPEGILFPVGSYAFYPCKEIILHGKNLGMLSDADYQAELAIIKQIEASVRMA